MEMTQPNKGNRANRANPWLVATSLTFLWPATLFAMLGQWNLYYSCISIVAASSLYHSTKLTPLYYIDMVAANSVAVLGTLRAIELGVPWIPVPGILYSILMFCVGYRYRQFVWHPSFVQATFWHITMHAAVLSCTVILANTDIHYTLGDNARTMVGLCPTIHHFTSELCAEHSSNGDYSANCDLQGKNPPSCSLVPVDNRHYHDDL